MIDLDVGLKIARAYGVLNEETGIPYRGLFIIDDKQRLRQITVNDLPVGRSVDETLRLVQAFQYTDVNGEGKPQPRLANDSLEIVANTNESINIVMGASGIVV